MDTGLDENQAELGVLVLAVALEVLADGNGLADISTSSAIRVCKTNRVWQYAPS